MIMKCPNCFFDNPEGTSFCNKCGTKLKMETIVKCRKCNTENPQGSVFCGSCGSKLNEDIDNKEPHTQKNEESGFLKKISSFFLVSSFIFLIYILFCIKFPSKEVVDYKYDDHIHYDAFVSDPLHILTCQPGESSVSANEALKNAKDRYILVILLFGGIGTTICIFSAWFKKK